MNKDKGRFKRLMFCLLLVARGGSLEGVFSAEARLPEDALQQALVREDWSGVLGLCGDNQALEVSPALRAIKAHACLALNRNNEALRFVLSLEGDREKAAWLDWARAFKEKWPASAAGAYLFGDAQLRLGRFADAEKDFDAALRLHPNWGIALLGKATLYANRFALEGEERWLGAARSNAQASIRFAPELAEAYACLGNVQLMAKAAEGAGDSLRRAIHCSQDSTNFALALNGLGCADYGEGKWSAASSNFAAAARILPLPLFLGNLRAVDVATENLYSPDDTRSPLFRFTDFLDWSGLVAEAARPESLLHLFTGGRRDLNFGPEAIQFLNTCLSNRSFYAQAIESHGASLRAMRVSSGASVPLKNREALEAAYPQFIANHNQRDPGMQLSVTQNGLKMMDALKYRETMTPGQIGEGAWRIDHLWSPMQHALDAVDTPITKFVSAEWRSHLDHARQMDDLVLKDKYNVALDRVMPGGVTTEAKQTFIDQGDWPVANWFGISGAGLATSAAYRAHRSPPP